jgi:hypothetical protein
MKLADIKLYALQVIIINITTTTTTSITTPTIMI